MFHLSSNGLPEAVTVWLMDYVDGIERPEIHGEEDSRSFNLDRHFLILASERSQRIAASKPIGAMICSWNKRNERQHQAENHSLTLG